jgi:hypothetical protein
MERIRPSVQRMLDAITGAPAAVLNGRLDMLATNHLARGLYSEMYVDPARPVNHARFVFLSPRAPDFYRDWEPAANDTVAILRTEAGRNPYDRDPLTAVSPPHVHRRARLEVCRGTRPPRELDRDDRRGRRGRDVGETVVAPAARSRKEAASPSAAFEDGAFRRLSGWLSLRAKPSTERRQCS